MVRFGMISWLPIYLLTVKHFSKEQMSVAFLFLSGRQFRLLCWPAGSPTSCLRAPDAVSYNLYDANLHLSDRLLEKRISADGHGIRGDCGLPYLCPAVSGLGPDHEIVPSFAVGSAVGLRGFMSYIFGASLGTSLFGVMVDKMGWHGGFYLLMGGIVCCILFCYLSHRGALELEQQRKITEQEEARLALADAQ